MKIYLTAINAKYIHSNLAVYSLRAFAEPFREQIEIGEFTINNRVDFILEEIYKAKPDVLCFSYYVQYPLMSEMKFYLYHIISYLN